MDMSGLANGRRGPLDGCRRRLVTCQLLWVGSSCPWSVDRTAVVENTISLTPEFCEDYSLTAQQIRIDENPSLYDVERRPDRVIR
jgi:hypothetical protein